ncbi:MAG: DNRLRE domain-containing protein [Planctomycetes bacterium]|nr:DNRLRE domain-containing protein [Planctomycetota bacterium]
MNDSDHSSPESTDKTDAYTSTGSWEEPGLTDPVDVGSTKLGSTKLGTLVGATNGSLEVSLNSEGRVVVQRWIDDPSKNQGFLLANVENGNSLRFDSREAAIADKRPRLTIDTSEAVPPTAIIVKPRDGGEADQDTRSGEVLVSIFPP